MTSAPALLMLVKTSNNVVSRFKCTICGSVVNHCILSGYLVNEHRMMREPIFSLSDEIQVCKSRFHHQHVCSFRHIPLCRSGCKSSATTWKLIPFPVSKCWS